jgi:hypothetical protein
MVRPGELVDIMELSPLTLNDRRTYNLLIAHAWHEITQPVVQKLSKTILRGSHESNDRLGESSAITHSCRMCQRGRDNDGATGMMRIAKWGNPDKPAEWPGRLIKHAPNQTHA